MVKIKSFSLDNHFDPEISDGAKPLIVLVYTQSLARLWMERSLTQLFRLCVFSNPDDALAFIKSTRTLDGLITELELGQSAIGGCNIARGARQLFPNCAIFVFPNGARSDHRTHILNEMTGVKMMTKPFDIFLLSRRLAEAFKKQQKHRNREQK